jgi:hypothetical protein
MSKRRNTKRLDLVVVVLCLCWVAAIGCIPGDGTATTGNPAGFFWGVWHGWIAPVSLVWGFFNPAVRLYEAANSGWWYDFGFYIAVIGGFGSLAFFRKNKSND